VSSSDAWMADLECPPLTLSGRHPRRDEWPFADSRLSNVPSRANARRSEIFVAACLTGSAARCAYVAVFSFCRDEHGAELFARAWRSSKGEMSRCGEIVRSVLGAAVREQSQACGSLLPVYYQSRETAVCLFSSEAPHHRPRARPAPHPLPTPLLRPSYRAIALRKCQGLTVPTAVSLVPTLASLGGCELSLERCLQPLHLKPAALNAVEELERREATAAPKPDHVRPTICDAPV
jgi:hypothetical protein